jgi:Zn-dependent protease with chaperone function
MNFFEQQESARRRTRLMLVLYLLAVFVVVLAVDIVIAVMWTWFYSAKTASPAGPGGVYPLLPVPVRVYVFGALGTLTVILGASIAQTLKLGAGGAAVAEMLGARRVKPNSTDRLERRLMNVVEEMAIASGVRVPAVYVMDNERAINAFAAGNAVSSAAVVVTRGSLEALNRDELQGVVAHEFSHILNGDMTLNIRMLGILAGIVFISSIGGFLMRHSRKIDGNAAGKAIGAVALLGLTLFVIGYIGLFFARLIKAAVSREREFLADASSVQFTRNPDGIAGALDQIRASGRGAGVDGRYAEEVAHMFFGQGIRVWLGGLFDTHPPIEERIRRVNPRFQPGPYRSRRPAPEVVDAGERTPDPGLPFSAKESPADGAVPGARATDWGMAWGRSPADSLALVGQLDAAKAADARLQLASLPPGLRDRLREPEGACAALIALLLAPREEVMAGQMSAARGAGAGSLIEEAARLAPQLRSLGPSFQLAIVDLALPAARTANAGQQGDLLRALEAVINADRRVSLNEFVMLTLVKSQLVARVDYQNPRYNTLHEVRDVALLLIGLCAQAGSRPGPQAAAQAAAAFSAGAKVLGIDGISVPARNAISLPSLRAALDTLRGLAPLPKAVLVKALFATVTADGAIRVIEAELLRMVSAVLDCPLPPLLSGAGPGSFQP